MALVGGVEEGPVLRLPILFYMGQWLSCLLLNHPLVEEKRNKITKEIRRGEEKAELTYAIELESLKS